MTIQEAQQSVDRWIRSTDKGYFSELTNLAVLTEEVGELARIFARTYGDQVAKPGDMRHSVADELADIMWVTLCLANQTGTDMEEALSRGLQKRLTRDADRFKKHS